MEAWNITHILYTQRSENSNPRITFYVLNKNDKTITYEMDWYDIPRNGYSPITATNSMLYSKSRQLFVYAFN